MTMRSYVLPVLIGLFAASASIKMVSGIGGAMAQSPAVTPPTAPRQPEFAQQIPPPDPRAMTATEPGAPPPSTEWIPELVVDLRHREEVLAAEQARIESRETALRDAEARIAEQIAALDAAESALSATMALADRAAETDLQRLTSVFEAMRPEQAAQVVAEMAPEFAAGLIGRLRPETAAAIFSGLEPRQAYALSAILAGRNSEVPRR